MSSADLGAKLRALHKPGEPFVLANAWDLGSAQLLAALGAEAIGTSSAAHAFTLGLPDGGHLTRDQAMDHAVALQEATGLPVSGDFENGFGHSPADCAETVAIAAARGLAGCSIEDTAFPDHTPYPFEAAVERIAAAAETARAAPQDFVLVARADGMMIGTYDLDEAIRRLQAFEAAGADCVYAPLPPDMDGVRQICAAVSVPVNILAAGPFTQVPLAEFAAAGAARVSLGSSLARHAHRAVIDAARALLNQGDFTALSRSIPGGDVDDLLTAGRLR
ncbi:MAG: isocitrate lyase/phosphoenolpyruvate mutase family protein [Pseudomonadota bacterium]